MDIKQRWESYTEFVRSLESPVDEAFIRRLVLRARDFHACAGIVTEAAELMDELKKYVAYGKEQDRVNSIEELGDLMFYVAMACDILGISLEDVLGMNEAKLTERYGKGYSHTRATERDLAAERNTLEVSNGVSRGCKTGCTGDCGKGE